MFSQTPTRRLVEAAAVSLMLTLCGYQSIPIVRTAAMAWSADIAARAADPPQSVAAMTEALGLMIMLTALLITALMPLHACTVVRDLGHAGTNRAWPALGTRCSRGFREEGRPAEDPWSVVRWTRLRNVAAASGRVAAGLSVEAAFLSALRTTGAWRTHDVAALVMLPAVLPMPVWAGSALADICQQAVSKAWDRQRGR